MHEEVWPAGARAASGLHPAVPANACAAAPRGPVDARSPARLTCAAGGRWTVLGLGARRKVAAPRGGRRSGARVGGAQAERCAATTCGRSAVRARAHAVWGAGCDLDATAADAHGRRAHPAVRPQQLRAEGGGRADGSECRRELSCVRGGRREARGRCVCASTSPRLWTRRGESRQSRPELPGGAPRCWIRKPTQLHTPAAPAGACGARQRSPPLRAALRRSAPSRRVSDARLRDARQGGLAGRGEAHIGVLGVARGSGSAPRVSVSHTGMRL